MLFFVVTEIVQVCLALVCYLMSFYIPSVYKLEIPFTVNHSCAFFASETFKMSNNTGWHNKLCYWPVWVKKCLKFHFHTTV